MFRPRRCWRPRPFWGPRFYWRPRGFFGWGCGAILVLMLCAFGMFALNVFVRIIR